jgi:hypothetical protein
MISSNDKEIEHFRGGGGGGGGRGGGGGGFGGGRGGYGGYGSGYGGISRGVVNNSSVDRNANIGYRGGYNGGNDDGYGWNNYPLIYNNYIPVDPNDNDIDTDLNNTVLLPPEITENFNNGGCNNQVSVVWYLISIILVLFIIYRN